MGKGTEENTERNTNLIIDYRRKENGVFKSSMLDLQKKYDITAVRIHQILKKNGIPPRERKAKK